MAPPTTLPGNGISSPVKTSYSPAFIDMRHEFYKWLFDGNAQKFSPQVSVACLDRVSEYVINKKISCSLWKISNPSVFIPIQQKVMDAKSLKIKERYAYKVFNIAGQQYLNFLKEKPWANAAETAIPDVTQKNETIDVSLPNQNPHNKLTPVAKRYLLPSDSIEKVELSVRSHNALRRAGVHTVEAMMSLDRAQMSNLKNLGAKSIDEIERIQREITAIDANSVGIMQVMQPTEEVPVFYDDKGIQYYDMPIDGLSLSRRAYRVLVNSGYDFASKLLGITAEDLLRLPQMGINSVNEIIAKISALNFKEVLEVSQKDDKAKNDCIAFVSRFIDHVPVHAGTLFATLLPLFEEAYERDEAVENEVLFKNAALRKPIDNIILDKLQNSMFGVYRDDLYSSFPDDVVPLEVVTEMLNELWSENKVRLGQMIELRRPTLWEYICSIEDEKQREILSLRLQGKTLEEIGAIKGGVTRERIRQVVQKCIRHKNAKQIVIEEDKYIEIFNSYSFSKDDFLLAFGVDDSAYIYLTLVCDKAGSAPMESFLEDTKYPLELRKGAESVAYKGYFTINGVRVLKQRAALADYVVHTYFQDEATMDEFESVYTNVLYELGEQNNEKFTLNIASYKNRLADTDNVLWKYPSRFRYYDMVGRDFSDLVEGLHFEQYSNVEYSSLKFFRSYPELMEEYDLRDEYELHNLLKKIYAKQTDVGISFSRMPIIEIGKANRNNQIHDLLIRLAPISVDDFCAEYEAEYGVLARTVAANYIFVIDKYRKRNGIYDITSEPLPFEQAKRLQEILSDDYYDIAFIKKLYYEEFLGIPDMINSYTLKSMGFNVFSSYVIKNRFSSASEYFRHILTLDDFVDAKSFPAALTSQMSYTVELYNLKRRYEVVEYEPQRYVSRRKLEALGVTITDLKDYCYQVSESIQPKAYFTIHSLRKQGFAHHLNETLNFSDCFFSSILAENKERYRYQRMGGTKVFKRDTQQILMEDLFSYILAEHGNMEINSFVTLLAVEYGVNLDKHKVAEVFNNGKMYYDKITGIVHANDLTETQFQNNLDAALSSDVTAQSKEARFRPTVFAFSQEEKNKIANIIAERFKSGLRVASSIDFERFVKFYAEEYGVDFGHDDNWFNRFISSEALIYDERAYIYSDDVVDAVRLYLEELESPCIFIDFFYNKFADEFYNMSIFSVDKLKAFVEKNHTDLTIKREYIFMSDGISPSDQIKEAFYEREVWTFEELYERLPCLKPDTIRQTLNGAEYFRLVKSTYTHIDSLDLPDSEGEKLARFVENRLHKRDYVTANELGLSVFENLNQHCPFNAIRDAVFQKFLSDSYDKSGQVITKKGERLRAIDVLEQYCREAATVSFEEISGLEVALDPKGRGHSLCLVAGHNIMVRVSEELFVADSSINFDIEKIDDAIALYCRGNFIPLRGITNFSLFPYTGYQWNLFLLESYVRKFSRVFKYDVRAVNSSNIGSIIRKSFQYNDYDEILAHALADSLVSLNDKKAVGNYLFDSGYIGWRNLGKKEENILNMSKKIREEG